MDYQYKWLHGPLAPAELIEQLAELYSNHYGIWSHSSSNPGQRIRLSSKRLRSWLKDDTAIALAYYEQQLVGYAIVARAKTDYGIISWVTQFVVHEEHRRRAVGRTLLFSMWGFTNHFAWGLVTANPYAIRALEKATRRRCVPERISRNKVKLANLGAKVVSYISTDTIFQINDLAARIDTQFALDHSNLDGMLAAVTTEEKPWLMGELPENWEWFAFTFQDQQQIGLTSREIEDMLKASDQVTQQAYSRMTLNKDHAWAQHTGRETAQIVEFCQLTSDKTVLDLGSGSGRHVLALAELGFTTTGVDYIETFIRAAEREANRRGLNNAIFRIADCRQLDLGQTFDAVICLYDVVGSYADEADNVRILQNIAKHLRPGGFSLISVMNFELTRAKATNFFSLARDPDKLLQLSASSTMEKTGNIFDPNYYMVDTDTSVVYRKEQFSEGSALPIELIVRDRRYTIDEIGAMCNTSGLDVVWSRPVRSGSWETALGSTDDKAKEILVLCRKAPTR